MRRIDLPIEQKPDIDPMLPHGWKIAADLPIAIRDRNRAILIFRGCRACGFDESSFRTVKLGRCESRVDGGDRNPKKRMVHGFTPASSACPVASNNCRISS